MNKEIDQKRFPEWIILKEKLHNIGRVRAIHEGDVWWCAMGENIGVEINGKNEGFSRPVLIFKKLSGLMFMGIPLSTQPHNGSWYAHFIFKDKNQYAVLAQARILSVSRLNKRIGTIPNSDFEIVKQGFKNLYIGK